MKVHAFSPERITRRNFFRARRWVLAFTLAPFCPGIARGAEAVSPAKPQDVAARARSGIAIILRGETPVGLGTILHGDGRVLSSSLLSPLDGLEARYANGTRTPLRVAFRDVDTDLVLLSPGELVSSGLRARDKAIEHERVLSVPLVPRALPVEKLTVSLSPLPLRTPPVQAITKEGNLFPVLEVVPSHVSPLPGAPLLDAEGAVAAFLGVVCKAKPPSAAEAKPPCSPARVAIPLSKVRAFLKTAAMAPVGTPWLGVQGEADATGRVRGVRLLATAKDGPAEKAGLVAHAERAKADMIVAVDGIPVESPEALSAAIARRKVGETIHLLVVSGDRFRDVGVLLAPAP